MLSSPRLEEYKKRPDESTATWAAVFDPVNPSGRVEMFCNLVSVPRSLSHAKASIVLWRTAADVFHIEVWRSFSRYVQQLLHESARQLELP